jgi:hypothetical protein
MNRKFIFLLIATILFSCSGFAQQAYKKVVKLGKHCSYQNRNVVNSLKNKIAILSRQDEFYILTVKGQKYMPCNLPADIKSGTIMISGFILQIFPNERLMATPLKLTKASLR